MRLIGTSLKCPISLVARRSVWGLIIESIVYEYNRSVFCDNKKPIAKILVQTFQPPLESLPMSIAGLRHFADRFRSMCDTGFGIASSVCMDRIIMTESSKSLASIRRGSFDHYVLTFCETLDPNSVFYFFFSPRSQSAHRRPTCARGKRLVERESWYLRIFEQLPFFAEGKKHDNMFHFRCKINYCTLSLKD